LAEQPTKQSKYMQQELTWFWCNSDADCNFKSSWAACLNAACFGQSVFSDPYTPFMLNAISSRAKIISILRQIPQYNQYVLFSIYGPTFYSTDIEELAKKQTGPLCCLMHHDELAVLCKQIRSGTAKGPAKLLYATLTAQAIKDRAESVELYNAAKKALKLKPLIKTHY
jgi:hypothetical protein